VDRVDFRSLVEAGDERADIAEPGVDAVQFVRKQFVGVVNAVPEVSELFVFEVLEFAFGQELGFDGSFAHELLADSDDRKSGYGGEQPLSEGGRGGSGKFGQKSGAFNRRARRKRRGGCKSKNSKCKKDPGDKHQKERQFVDGVDIRTG